MIKTKEDSRSLLLDGIKGVSIVAVVLYHFGGNVLPYGYLGVDVFFTVGGYLLFIQLERQISNKRFEYISFIFKKLLRLWPPVLLVTLVSMASGFFLMLPNDYENLAESAVASTLFANNILQCVTTKNYWDIVNLYKPLMHLWYVGVLMQAYILLPIVSLIMVNLCKNVHIGMAITTISITVISLTLFLIPSFSSAWKFYYLPFRLFEITSGGILALYTFRQNNRSKKIESVLSLFIILGLICSRWEIGSAELMLILTVIATMLFIESSKGLSLNALTGKIVNVVATIGKSSYSVYIWHQMIIAFLFYSVYSKHSVKNLIIIILLTAIISILSYKTIELPLKRIENNKKMAIIALSSMLTLAILLSVGSFNIYLHAGVTRDVPELGIVKNNVHRGMHSEYCDRVYSWDRPFNKDSMIKVLVIGNSFGRDWANVLYEYNSDLDISFIYYSESALMDNMDRVDEADYVFYALGLAYGEVPEVIDENIDNNKLYIVSNKNYGVSNGIIYSHKNTTGYYEQTVDYSLALQNDITHNKKIWNSHFIDMMEPVLTRDNRIRVFTDDKKFISQDCRHLTQAGAQYYSRLLNLDAIFSNKIAE